MKTLNIKKYNEMRTKKWSEDYSKALNEGRQLALLPQLAFYIFNRSYGYVAFNDTTALWNKTKSGAIQNWEDKK